MKNFLLLIFLLMLSSISKTQAPLNNSCAFAQEIVLPSPGERICVSGTTVGASATFGNSFWICSGNGQDVWYTFTTSNNIEFYVDFIRGTIGNGVEINFFSQCPPGGYINFEGCYSTNFSFIMNLQSNTTYYMLVYNGRQGNNPGQGTFEICIESEPLPLPVTLTSFTTECDNGITLINWTTVSEQNSDYFQIERSRDGMHWAIVSKVTALGTSSIGTSYQFYDILPGLYFEGYYRLKQVDFDGQYEYFNPIYSNCVPFEYFEFSVYPNPVEDVLIIKLINASSNEVRLNLFDVAGRLIFSNHSKLENKTDLILLDVPNLHTGQYLLEISSGSEILTKRIIKK
jgi:hypothetical protein